MSHLIYRHFMKVAMIQMLVKTSDVEGNLERACKRIKEVANRRVDVICLPETCIVGWLSKSTEHLAEPIPGRYSDIFCTLASRLRCYIVGGLVEKDGEKFYNSAILINREGKIILKHRKIIVFARRFLKVLTYEPGSKIESVDTEFGKIGLCICSDGFESWIIKSLARMSTRIIFTPCAWAISPNKDIQDPSNNAFWKSRYSQYANDNKVYIVAINSVGTITEGIWKNHLIYGGSIAYGPGGDLLVEGEVGREDLVILKIEL